MALAFQLAGSIDPMLRSGDTASLICGLVTFALVYLGAFVLTSLLSTAGALVNRSAQMLHGHGLRWVSSTAFDSAAYCLFAAALILVAPVALHFLFWRFDIAAVALCLFWSAGAYHGVMVGSMIDDFGRIPSPGDFIRRILPD
jgi:hypothetical protein